MRRRLGRALLPFFAHLPSLVAVRESLDANDNATLGGGRVARLVEIDVAIEGITHLLALRHRLEDAERRQFDAAIAPFAELDGRFAL